MKTAEADQKAVAMKGVARQIGFRRLLVETDAPFLAPTPHRGKRNEPAFVRIVAQEIAQLRECDPNTVARRSTDNALALFQRLPEQREAA